MTPENLQLELLKFTYNGLCSPETGESFRRRILEGSLTRSENLTSHISTYCIACDIVNDKVFIGHHRKSGLWICNGGHCEKGEFPVQTAKREFFEELGIDANFGQAKPELLTITRINNERQACKVHFDFWFFHRVNSKTFRPDRDKLRVEFFEAGWKSFEDARKLVTDPATLIALDKLESM